MSPCETGLLSTACADRSAAIAVALGLRLADHQEHSNCQTSLESSRTANDSNSARANHGGRVLSHAFRLKFAVSRTTPPRESFSLLDRSTRKACLHSKVCTGDNYTCQRRAARSNRTVDHHTCHSSLLRPALFK